MAKIALFFNWVYPPTQGGPSTFNYYLAEKLAINHKVFLFTCLKKRSLINSIYNQVLQISFIIRLINNDYDIIILPCWQIQDVYRYLIKIFSNKPYVLLFIGSDFFDNTYPSLIKKGSLHKLYGIYLKNSMLKIIESSSGILSSIDIFESLNKFNVDKEKDRLLPIIYNIKDVQKIVINKSPWKKDDSHHILFFGNLIEGKGVRYLIYAVPYILLVTKKVKFHIIGDGPLLSELISFVKNNHLDDHVVFHEYVNHNVIGDYILAADIVVNPLVYGASLGTSSIETLCLKKPLIIGNANAHIKQIYLKYHCYLIVEPKNEKDISEKILMLLDKNNSDAVVENIDKFIKNELYDKIIEDKLNKAIEDSINYHKNYK